MLQPSDSVHWNSRWSKTQYIMYACQCLLYLLLQYTYMNEDVLSAQFDVSPCHIAVRICIFEMLRMFISPAIITNICSSSNAEETLSL